MSTLFIYSVQLCIYVFYPASFHCNVIGSIFNIFASCYLSLALPQTVVVAGRLVRLRVVLGWDLFLHVASLDVYHPLLNHNINNTDRYVGLCGELKNKPFSQLFGQEPVTPMLYSVWHNRAHSLGAV